jgi:hypothetical protein
MNIRIQDIEKKDNKIDKLVNLSPDTENSTG